MAETMQVRTARHQVETRKYARNDFHWPGLVLPVKRYYTDNRMEVGYLTNPASKDGSISVHLGNMWDAKVTDKVFSYTSVDAFIADGWEVD